MHVNEYLWELATLWLALILSVPYGLLGIMKYIYVVKRLRDLLVVCVRGW